MQLCRAAGIHRLLAVAGLGAILCGGARVSAAAVTAYSNLSGVSHQPYPTSAVYNVQAAPFADIIRGRLLLDDVVVDSTFWGQFVTSLTVNFYKGLGPHSAPQMEISVYDTSGPNGGPGVRLYTLGVNSSAFPAVGEGTFTFPFAGNTSPIFQVPANGKMWIGYQFSAYGTPGGPGPVQSLVEMSSISTLAYGPSEVGSTATGIWVSDASSAGPSGPPQSNPTGSFVAQVDLNLGLKVTVDMATPPPRGAFAFTNSLGPALGSSHVVADHQFLGTRFTLTQPLEVNRIDLAVTGANDRDWFVAIVALTGTNGSPTASAATGLADLGQVKMSKLFNPGSVSSFKVVSVPLSVRLGPGSYAVVMGAGLFGSPAGPPASGGAFGSLQNYGTITGSNTLVWTKPATGWSGPQFDILANGTPTYGIAMYADTFVDVPVIASQPQSAAVSVGQSVILSVGATAFSPLTYQWRFNGANIPGATQATLAITNVQLASTGVYDVVVTLPTGTATSRAAVLGLTASGKAAGSASEVASNLRHTNGNVYDQILLTGPSATVTADAGQVTRVSFIDLSDDIVQVEFSGAGAMTIALAGASGPALPVRYNQNVNYMKGHATISIVGADETTNVAIFSVGRATAVDDSLFQPVYYDGVADIALLSIQSANGKFGGVRAGNASLWARSGMTGIVAPGIQFSGPVYFGSLNGFESATAALLLGGSSDVRITGSNLQQTNGRAVRVSGITQLRFVDGSNSFGNPSPARNNLARLEEDGVDVTSQIVVNPAP